ncbi:MAG TPA: GGDEF domain-containing protein [bacterium]|nr:GGDEF domain-containing protein [bacterium]HPQ20012.1 GGDEF domain-containing protein [bacterium]
MVEIKPAFMINKNKKFILLLLSLILILQIISLYFSFDKNNINKINGLFPLTLFFFFLAAFFFFYLIINNFKKIFLYFFLFDIITFSIIFLSSFIPFLEKFFCFDIYINNYIYNIINFNFVIIITYFLFRFFSEENYKKNFNTIKPLLENYEEEYLYMNEYYRLEETKFNEIEKHSKSLIEIFDLAGELQKEFLIDNFMKKFISKINDIIEFDKGLFVILSFEKKEPELYKKYYIKSEEKDYEKIEINTILSNIIIHKKILFLNHSITNISLELLENYNILIIPLIAQKKIIGFFLIERINRINYNENMYFKKEDIYKLQVIILQTSINLHKCFLYEKLQKLAIYDSLTGLFVHNKIKQNLVKEINRSKYYNLSLSLLMCDIDFFKNFNDTYGHEIGDEVLKTVANILKNSIRESDYVGRYGGEEFMIILTEANKENANKIAERIRQNIESNYIYYKNNKLKITISIGISTYPEDGNDEEEIIKAADKALYTAKKKGRNRVELYNKEEK